MKKNLSSHAAAAAAIRSELKTWFPSTKFRVTSDSFAKEMAEGVLAGCARAQAEGGVF